MLIIWISCGDNASQPSPAQMQITGLHVGINNLLADPDQKQPVDKNISISFSHAIADSGLEAVDIFLGDQEIVSVKSFADNNKTVILNPDNDLEVGVTYTLKISDDIKGAEGEIFPGFEINFTTDNPPMVLRSLKFDDREMIGVSDRIQDIPVNSIITAQFSDPVDIGLLKSNFYISGGGQNLSMNFSQINDSTFQISVPDKLVGFQKYTMYISQSLKSVNDKTFNRFDLQFYTALDPVYKFPELADDELLTLVQKQTFKYFWDFGHPTSGLARERNNSGETVTIGGSGFGIMSILVGIERGFVTRTEGVERISKIVNFLATKADRFHGVWSHWLNGTSGDVIPFSTKDNGGDLVESAFMLQGLLTVRQYLNENVTEEKLIIDQINTIWNEVEWDWYTKGGENVLYWHWSPNYNWEMNHQISGWNEAMIVYVLAASSQSHGISKDAYTAGWSRNGAMMNTTNASYYGYKLELRTDRGGPLFFTHYSFMGLDPRNLSDQYADYWKQNVNHTLINQAYCVANPKKFVGYSDACWGLTASDNQDGYNAQSPDNDLGVITPTAALSSMPYTPEESMKALKTFYYLMGDKLWGEYGFYDAFNVTEGWTASSYLAIDQGPIIVMIENYRTGLLWDLFMSAPEVQAGLTKLNISYE